MDNGVVFESALYYNKKKWGWTGWHPDAESKWWLESRPAWSRASFVEVKHQSRVHYFLTQMVNVGVVQSGNFRGDRIKPFLINKMVWVLDSQSRVSLEVIIQSPAARGSKIQRWSSWSWLQKPAVSRDNNCWTRSTRHFTPEVSYLGLKSRTSVKLAKRFSRVLVVRTDKIFPIKTLWCFGLNLKARRCWCSAWKLGWNKWHITSEPNIPDNNDPDSYSPHPRRHSPFWSIVRTSLLPLVYSVTPPFFFCPAKSISTRPESRGFIAIVDYQATMEL